MAAVVFFAANEGECAEIVRLTKNNLSIVPKGKEVDGMIGDWVIKNNKVIAVIGEGEFDRGANQMVSSVQGAVPEGYYQVTLSPGPEYDAEIIYVKAIPVNVNVVSVNMKKTFTSQGYVIADFHNHTTKSGDSNAATAD
ncbi:MAG TPA: hypothetical protein VNI52_00725 [Sphingobacteriaceae bacterium]|nr:hypothetical protein [Sphingobacteriaceae bacterium]